MRAKPKIAVKYEDGTTRTFRYRPCLDQADVESALKVSATGERLASGDFEGGKTGAVKVLEKLGFTIQPRRPATQKLTRT